MFDGIKKKIADRKHEQELDEECRIVLLRSTAEQVLNDPEYAEEMASHSKKTKEQVIAHAEDIIRKYPRE